MKKITIHQPQFIPYLSFYNKVIQSDIYVVLDDVKATNKDFTNRNKVRAPNGESLITIPVNSKNININQIRIVNDIFIKKHIKTFQNFYTKTPFFEEYFDEIAEIYQSAKWEKLIDFDMALLKWTFEKLDINVKIVYSSSLNTNCTSTDRLIEICKALDGQIYISGLGAKDYLNKVLFEENKIKLVFQNFKHPEYKQKFDPFIPNLSVIDALFNCGADKVRKLILKNKYV